MFTANPQSRIRLLLASLAFVAAVCAVGEAGDAKPPRLLFVLADPSTDASGKLAQCEKLTIEEYRKRGVDVIRLPPADLEQWLAGEGQSYQKAHEHFQHLAIAKAKHADAVGGLTALVLEPSRPNNGRRIRALTSTAGASDAAASPATSPST